MTRFLFITTLLITMLGTAATSPVSATEPFTIHNPDFGLEFTVSPKVFPRENGDCDTILQISTPAIASGAQVLNIDVFVPNGTTMEITVMAVHKKITCTNGNLLVAIDDEEEQMQQAEKICRDRRTGTEVAAEVTDTSIVLSHSTWEKDKIVNATKKGASDFEDMRLTIRDVHPRLVFWEDGMVVIAQPMITFGTPNCFVTTVFLFINKATIPT